MPKPPDVSGSLDPPIADPAMCVTSHGRGALPRGGFNAFVPELDVSDLVASLRFWCDLLGFEVAYDRPAARFAYLARGPIHVMLCERNGNWEVGELSRQFRRGISLQMMVGALAPILGALEAADWPLFREPTEAWYRAGDHYLLRFAQDVGVRTSTQGRFGSGPAITG